MHDYILSTDAARGMQRKHSKLMRDLDRVRSLLPPEVASDIYERVDVPDADGRLRRAYRIPRKAMALLFMGHASKTAVVWAAENIR